MGPVLDSFAGLDVFGWLEILAMAAGIYYVFLEIRKTKLLWYVCILTSVLNMFVYQHNNYLSMTLIQFYYVATAVYGLYAFSRIREEAAAEGRQVAIRRFDWKVGGIALVLGIAAFFLLVPLLQRYGAAHPEMVLFPSQPYWDAFIAVGSMVGTFFLSKSYMCQWYVWIVLDLVTVGVFVYSGMYWMAVMYLVYVVLCFFGIRNWRANGVYVD